MIADDVAGKLERRLACQTLAGDRGAPVFLHMRDDAIESLEMMTRVAVKRVRQVAAQHRVLVQIRHLPNAKRPAEHTAIRMHSDQNHVVDSAGLQQVEDFLAVGGDRVGIVDLNGLDLPLPNDPRRAAGFGRVA